MKLCPTAVNRGKLENLSKIGKVTHLDQTIWLRNDYVIHYLEDFKTSNIEYTDEAGSFSGCFVEWFVNSIYDPLEEFLVKGLWKGFNNEINFVFWLSFGDIFTTDLKMWFTTPVLFSIVKNCLQRSKQISKRKSFMKILQKIQFFV